MEDGISVFILKGITGDSSMCVPTVFVCRSFSWVLLNGFPGEIDRFDREFQGIFPMKFLVARQSVGDYRICELMFRVCEYEFLCFKDVSP